MKFPSLWATGFVLASLSLINSGFAQGDLTPPGGPKPTMKSLQEVWDKLGVLEKGAAQQQKQLQLLQSQNNTLQQQVGLLSGSAVNFAWVTTIIDPASTGYPSLAFAPDGQPAIAYRTNGLGGLKFARFDGSAWTITLVDPAVNVGYLASLAFDPDGQPAISYIDDANDDLKFARFDGTDWTITVIDPTGVAFGNSLAFGPDGQPAIAYQGSGANQLILKFAHFDGTSWELTTVDAPPGIANSGSDASLKFKPDGQPAIAHRYTSGDNHLRYSHRVGLQWFTALVDDGGSIEAGFENSLAFGPDGQPSIGYRDSQFLVKLARFNGNSWLISPVRGGGNYPSLAFSPSGQPAVAFAATSTGNIIFTQYASSLDGPSWPAAIVDLTAVLTHTDLAFGPDGQPAIAYQDILNSSLKFSRKGLFRPAP